MRLYNFEYLTAEQNRDISIQWDRYNKMLQRGLVTTQEATFLFIESMLQTYKEKAFSICTNCKEFKKEK